MNLRGAMFSPLQCQKLYYTLYTSIIWSFALIRNHGFSLGISQIYQRANEFIKGEKERETLEGEWKQS